MRRIAPYAGFLVAGLLLGSCPAPPPVCDLTDAAAVIAQRWPNAQAARDDRDVYVDGAIWYWSHGKASVDGTGPTMVVLDEAIGVDQLWDHIHHVQSELSAEQPNLLFFDQTDGPLEEWPLIGFGYAEDYVPCAFPEVACLQPEHWLVHEAGYHRVPLGDGGMDLATTDDLRPLAASTSVDDYGCEPVYYEDLRVRRVDIRHGRIWTTHVWLDPDGGPPVIAAEDPWMRWEDAPDPVAIEGRAFFVPVPEQCTCEVAERPALGCL